MGADEEERVRRADELIREASALIGKGDPERLRVLIDMIRLELDRELTRVKKSPGDRSARG